LARVGIREHLYITLCDLLIDALASEHGARLMATQSAEQWLGERTDRLRRRLAAARREASTQETIEIAAGARARRAPPAPSAPPGPTRGLS
jgi:F0F1-type ATP synthase gamma subunit